ncbi:chemotaxis protein CheW [Granulicella paludicola]|uniref:chemotaxis protein CheW n=1 Tax=Granulicella paludicola TaxID=474951 RepID=UPI0021E0E9F9|nr:chemotaxis protein CheW [Granulicella paludicola]
MSERSQPLSACDSKLADINRYSTFYVDGHFFGIAVLRVQEVLRSPEITRVPLAPPVIEGLMNLRGQIVTAVDMRRRLNVPTGQLGQAPISIVVRTNDGVVSLLVDEIGDVLDAPADAFERLPESLTLEESEIIEGVYKLDGKLMLVLDLDRALEIAA